jgi:hypothetical protein
MVEGSNAASASSLARFRSSGAGSAPVDPVLSCDDDSVDSVGDSDDDSVGACDDDSADSVGDSDDDSVGASDDDCDELGVEEPALCGFSVLAPHADATMPATASAAITEVTRDKRDIDSYLSATKVVLR